MTKKLAPAKKAYNEARSQAWEAYDEARAQAWKAYNEAGSPAKKAYDEARSPAKKAYNEAVAQAWEAYNEAVAQARKAYNLNQRNKRRSKMICPLKNLGHLINYESRRMYTDECDTTCAWRDEQKKQCCIKTLSELKISGGIDTHPY